MKTYSTERLPSQQLINALYVVLSQNEYNYSDEVELELIYPIRDSITYHKVFISEYLTKQQFKKVCDATNND